MDFVLCNRSDFMTVDRFQLAVPFYLGIRSNLRYFQDLKGNSNSPGFYHPNSSPFSGFLGIQNQLIIALTKYDPLSFLLHVYECGTLLHLLNKIKIMTAS